MDEQELGRNLSTNLRWLRERRGVTQAALGEVSGVPRSTIAALESGSSNPTLGVVARLATGLQVTLDELLSAPKGLGNRYPRGTLPEERRGPKGLAVVQTLLPDPIPGLEFQRLVLPHGARFAGVPHRPGTREYLYVESGEVVLNVSGERFEVSAGDVVSFRGDQAHAYAAVIGDAVAISVVALAPG